MFLGSFVSVLAVGLTRTLNTLILPLKSHIPQFAWRWQDHVGWNKLPADPSSPRDLSLACYSNQHHSIVLPLPGGRLTLRQGHLRAGASAAVQKEVMACRNGNAPYLLLTQPLFLLLFLHGLSLLSSKRQNSSSPLQTGSHSTAVHVPGSQHGLPHLQCLWLV